MNRTLLLLLLAAWSLPATADRLSTGNATDPLRLAAEDAAACRMLRDSDVRLACLDAAADRLAVALSPKDQATQDAEDLTTGPAAPAAPDDSAAVEPSGEATGHPPNWASAPEEPESEPVEMPSRFEATIVRITSNNVGRHRFYTADGAIWEQTQLVEVREPSSLPAVAEFRRRLTGNPTIKFDVSNRSYRVKRIE